MKRRGLSGGGGAAQDVEPEWCCLAGIVFLGAIVVTDGSESEKKMHTRRNRRRSVEQKLVEGKNGHRGVFKEAWNTSRFLHHGEDKLPNSEAHFVVAD